MSEKPAEAIEVTLFRQILLVPFAIEAKGAGGRAIETVRVALARQLEGDPERRWVRVTEPLLHLPEDRVPDGLAAAERARQLAPAYEEFVYFEPYVQEFLFGTSEQAAPLELWRSANLEGASIEIDHDLGEPQADRSLADTPTPQVVTFRFAVERCNLYVFPTGNAILALELRLLEQAAEQKVFLDAVLRLLESVRRMFPPFFVAAGWQHGDPKAALEARYFVRRLRAVAADGRPLWQGSYAVDPVATIETVVGGEGAPAAKATPLFEPWRQLLQPLGVKGLAGAKKGEVVLTQLGDDRAFVLAQVGVRDPLEIAREDWVRLCFLDTPGDGMPYAEEFLKDFEAQHCYDRFYSRTPHDWQTTRYLLCGYAMVAVGKTPGEGEAGAVDCFFRHVLAKHLRRQYFDLVLIALLQKTALKTLSDKIADVAGHDTEAVTAIQQEVLAFTHRYWFEDISAQLQGHELFELLRRHLRLRALYEQIAQESREANALAVQ